MSNFELFKFKNDYRGSRIFKTIYTKEFISFGEPFFHIYIENCTSFCYEFFRVNMKKSMLGNKLFNGQ